MPRDDRAAMRIAYGVHGHGRGHAMRVGALLPGLTRRHAVRVFAGGDAREVLLPRADVEPIPCLRYVYRGERVSWTRTVAANAAFIADLVGRGAASRNVEAELERFRPDVVVSDTEGLVLRAAARLGIPAIGLDHVGVIGHCRPAAPPADRAQLALDGGFYRFLVGSADRAIVSSFYQFPARRPGIRFVAPILRERVLAARPTEGAHLLVYFNQGRHLYAPHVHEALRVLAAPVVAYGTGRDGQDGSVTFRPFDEAAFVEDLASCRAVLATGGHQLMGEAIHLGKPMLVAPEASAEQRLNARELDRLGLGRQVAHRDISAGVLREFLAEVDRLRATPVRPAPGSGNAAAIEAIESFACELASASGEGAPARRTPDWLWDRGRP
jgi:uncharacterized protein (TIGR00661 family)